MLIRNVKEKGGTGKLRTYWEPNIFEVLQKDKNIPVYTVKNLTDEGDTRVIHRNLRCNDLPLGLFENKLEKKRSNNTGASKRMPCD